MNQAPCEALDAFHMFAFPLPEPTGAQVRRRARKMATVVAHRFGKLAWRRARGHDVGDLAYAAPLRRTFEDLGSTFLKFGQMISSSPGLFGDELSAEFRSCLDTGPAVPFATVKRTIEMDLGTALEDVFAYFEEEPLAAASMAVVHRARLRDGTPVAVKVLRPNIEMRVACDLELIGPLVDLLGKLIGGALSVRLGQLVEGFRDQIAEELDLRNEARAQQYYLQLLSMVELPLVTVPRPYPEHSGRTVLTMEFLDGVAIDDLAATAEMGVDPTPLVDQMVRANFMTLLRNGVFHGDVHAGNLMLLSDGRLAMVDWGIVGRLDPDAYRFFRRMIEASMGDESAWHDVAQFIVRIYGPAVQDALGLDDTGLAQWMRNMVGPMLNQPFGQVSLADFLMAPQREIERAAGLEAEQQSTLQKLRKYWHLRQTHNDAELTKGLGTDFDRSMFLLTKQLLYFERYGKMFLGDVAILGDRDFFEKVLAAPPIEA